MSIYGNGLSGSHVQMWELNHKGGWTPKKWCFWTVVLEKTLESPLDCKEIKLVNPKGNQFWIFIGRIDAEAETPILRPPDAKNWFTGKDPDAGKDWRQEKGMTEEWDGWMDQWTRIWANYGRQWGTGKPGMLQSMGSRRAGHDLAAEQQQMTYLHLQHGLKFPHKLHWRVINWISNFYGFQQWYRAKVSVVEFSIQPGSHKLQIWKSSTHANNLHGIRQRNG